MSISDMAITALKTFCAEGDIDYNKLPAAEVSIWVSAYVYGWLECEEHD